MSDYLDLLHPAQREILQELARDLDYDPTEKELTQALLKAIVSGNFQQKISAQAKSVSTYPANFAIANPYLKSLPTERAPGKSHKPKPKSQPKPPTKLSPLERERFLELDDEIKKGQLEQGSRRLPAVPSKTEILQYLDTVRQAWKDGKNLAKRDYLLLRLFYATGCRRSEIGGIRNADLHLNDQRIFIRDGKGNKDRYVLIDSETVQLLAEQTKGREPHAPLFKIDDRQMNNRVVHWGEAVGLVERYHAQDRTFSSHSLRHSFATHMYEAGAQLFTIRELLGHEYLSTTEIYISVGVGKLQGDYTSYHPLATEDSSTLPNS